MASVHTTALVKAPVGEFRVRCLGFGPEHTFLSTDPIRHRRCPACEDKLRHMNLGARALAPATDHNGREDRE